MIYLLEDEISIQKLVIYTLHSTGLESRGFSTAEDFWQAMREQTPQLVLLDIMLPDADGLEVLKQLRGDPVTAKLPVMMLSAKGTEYDRVLGLDMGADDYLPKPFGMMELVARVKSLLRRTATETERPQTFQKGELSVDVPRHIVTVQGKPVVLTLKEFDVLVYLLNHQGLVLTREQIMSGVWGYDFDGESRTVDVHVRMLRSKLGDCANLIETVRGVGYQIVK